MKALFAGLSLVLILLLFASCNNHSENADTIFREVENIVEQYPDSALHLLDSIQNPYQLIESQFAQFVLRSVQAKHKAEKDISADTLIFRARDYYQKGNDWENLGLSLFYCGQVLQAQGKLEEATEMYLEARTLADKEKNAQLSALTNFYLGMLNYEQHLCEEARLHFKLADWESGTAKVRYQNEIAIKTYIANSFLLEYALDSALFYYREGLEIAKQHNDLDEQIVLNQIMSVALLDNGNISLSKEVIKHALLLSSQTNHKDRLPEIYLSLSNVYQAGNQIDSALHYTNLALKLSEDNNLKSIAYEKLSELEESKGNLPKSLDYLRLFADFADSVYSHKQDNNIIEVGKKYNFEMIQNANRKLIIERLWITIALIISGLVFAIVLFFAYKKRVKNNESLFLAKQQIYQLKEIVTKHDKQEDENNEINKKLRIALVEQLDIIKKVSLLEGFLSDGDGAKLSGKVVLQKVNKIIYKSTEELDWSAFFQSVNALYDDFLIRLAQAYPSLTEDEILICCLLKIGLSNEEIRLLLKSTPNIVQKKKSSIREKTGMKKQEHFVKQLDDLVKSE